MSIASTEINGEKNPVAAAAAVVGAWHSKHPDHRALALWLADAVLAQKLHLPAPMPLLAAHLKRPDGGPEALDTACALAYARGAAAAGDLYRELARRAEKLRAVRQHLRGKRPISPKIYAGGNGWAASRR